MARPLVATRLAAEITRRWLVQAMTVYTPDPTTGAVTVVAADAVACRLVEIPATAAASADGRASLLGRMRLYWTAGYAMPAERVQIAIDGQRWELVRGTEGQSPAVGGPILYFKIDVVQVGR